MNKRGKETVLTAYIILITIALVGGFMAYAVSSPTASVVLDTTNPKISITALDAVFDPDGLTSFKLAASAKENFNLGLTGKFILSLETGNDKVEYEGFVFFDGVFGEIRSLKIKDIDGITDASDVSGTVVVTNAIDDTATLLVKFEFYRPVKDFFNPPSKLLVNFDFTTYDKTFESKILPIRHAERPNPFPYYLTKLQIGEIKV